MYKKYIGDSVYIEWDNDRLILTTENGYPDDPRNRIVLEPETYSALKLYVENLAKIIEQEGQNSDW